MAVERTFVIIKPEAVDRGLVGEILARFERKGLRIGKLRVTRIDVEVAEEHYAHHRDKPFFPSLLDAITCGPVVLAVLEGENAVGQVRKIIGVTDPAQAAPGTIRGDFALCLPLNMVHAADSSPAAQAEIERFFP